MMGLGNLTLNIMSLGGLALGVGLLIDNSIVMLENIFRHREEGNEDPSSRPRTRARRGVTSAVVASTRHQPRGGRAVPAHQRLAALIFRELILTISFAILASLTVALTLVPMLSAQLAKVRFTSHLSETRFDAGVRPRHGLAARPIAAPPGCRAAGAGPCSGRPSRSSSACRLTSGLGNEFLPQVDDGNVGVFALASAWLDAGADERSRTRDRGMVREMPDVQSMFATAGGLFGGSTAERSGRGNLDIRLVPAPSAHDARTPGCSTLQARIDERGFPGARVFVRPPRIRGLRTSFSGDDVSITIQGDELPELQRIAAEITQSVKGVPGLENLELSSAEEASPQLDRARSRACRVSGPRTWHRSARPCAPRSTAPSPRASRRATASTTCA
jgi:multidrug efflux pump subunit AcrB